MWETFKWVLDGLIVALIILIGMIWKNNNDKHAEAALDRDKLGTRIDAVENVIVTKDTIFRIENDWRDEIAALREERKENHRENTRRLDKIDETMLKVVEIAVVIRGTQEEISSLRADRHRHGNMIQDHEARLSFQERKGEPHTR